MLRYRRSISDTADHNQQDSAILVSTFICYRKKWSAIDLSPFLRAPFAFDSQMIGLDTGFGPLPIWVSLSRCPRGFHLKNVFKNWAGATCRSIPPTFAVDNDLQLLEVETLWRDGTFCLSGRLRAKTAGTPGLWWKTAPSITALRCCYSTLHNNMKAPPLILLH